MNENDSISIDEYDKIVEMELVYNGGTPYFKPKIKEFLGRNNLKKGDSGVFRLMKTIIKDKKLKKE